MQKSFKNTKNWESSHIFKMSAEAHIVKSSMGTLPIPDEPIMTYVFRRLREGLKHWPADKNWIVDIPSGRSIKLSEVESNAYKIGSALTKMGLKHGDCVYFVTFELAQFYQIQVSLFTLGGFVRGCHPTDKISNFAKQMNEVKAKFAIVDHETVGNVREALKDVHHPVQLISVGGEKVPGSIHFSELLEDDGKGFPTDVKINPAKDVAIVINTSGSTGDPKGVVHSQKSVLSGMINLEAWMGIRDSMMEFMTNYGVISNGMLMYDLCNGVTTYHFTKFQKEHLFDGMIKYKPSSIILYPYIAAWMAKLKPELAKIREMDFLKILFIGGWVLDTASADSLFADLPNTFIKPIYGMSEIFCASLARVGDVPEKIPRCVHDGNVYTSSGTLLPNVEGKVINMATKEAMGPFKIGEILIRSPSVMKGYLTAYGQPLNRVGFTDDWLHTGDVGFFDDKSDIYVLERLTFVYKHMCHFVSPSEIEAVLLEHPDVSEVGVVGIPDPEAESLGRAFVVKRPGSKCSEEELVKFVADRMPFFKHLHKGVRFLDALPFGLGGKMDRGALKRMAIIELN